MTKKIIAFGASNSPVSINKKLAVFTANQLQNVEIEILDLIDFDLPVYSPAIEKSTGVPSLAQEFAGYIQKSDGIIISLAEYNGLHTAAFKNLWDWMSRLSTPKIWHDKPMFLIGTSPSKRENSYVMKVSQDLFPNFGADIISSFHLPSFNHFFKDGKIIEAKQKEQFTIELDKFQLYLNNN
jgi:NAD(P)H-dependent FMN reductase